MKKTLAILLSCMLIVGVVFAMFITSSADEPATEIFASTIKVRVPDGADDDLLADEIYVGRQPLYEDAENPTRITGYSDEVKNNPLTLGSGTLTLDAATGTVTIENISNVVGIHSATGSMTLVVKGTNTIDATIDPDGEGEGKAPGSNNVQVGFYQAANADAGTPEYRGNLTIKGDGVLNVKSNAYCIVSNSGGLEITENVTINGETTDATGNNEVIHVASTNSNPCDMVFSGDVKVNTKSHKNGIRMAQAATSGTMIIKDNADLKVVVDTASDGSTWGGAIVTSNFEMISGNLDIDFTSVKDAPTGLNFQKGTSVKLIGGKIDIKCTTTANRVYGIFIKDNPSIDFLGTDLNIEVESGAGGKTDSYSTGVIGNQSMVVTVNFAAGKLTYKGGANSDGLFGHQTNATINISGGEISGSANSFISTTGKAVTLNITGGTFDTTSAVVNVAKNGANAAGTSLTQTASSSNAYAAKYVVDAAAKTFKATGIAAPADLKAGSVTKDDAPITWAAVTDAVGYNVYVDGKKVNDAPVTTTSYTVPVMPNTKYAIAVSAINPLGGENRAVAISVTTPDGISSRVPPAAPTGLKLVGADAASAVVAWDAVDKAEGYFVYVDGVQVNEEAITAPVYKLTALEAGKEVTVLVKAASIAGKSEDSASIKVAPVASDKLTLVEVVLADGTSAYLGAGNTTVNGATGTVAFDAATGTVTVTDVTGVDSILGAKKMTVVFKGASEMGANAGTNVLTADELIIEGDGSVKIEAAKATYPIFAGKSLVVQGSVKLTMKAPAGSALLHAGRVGGDCSVIVKGNAVLDVSGTGRGLYAAGEKTTVIVTENANVTLETTGDTIAAVCDTDDEGYTGPAGGFVEFSGNAKVLVKNGNCGIRVNFNIKGEHDATVSLICKDNAYVDITAPGQTAYLVDGAGANSKGKVVSVFTVQDNAFLKLTNNGPASNGNLYPALQLKTDGNTVTIDGGTLELVGHPEKACYAVGGKTTYKFDGYKTFVGGVDKASAKDVTKFSTTDKYIMITFGNPPTADVNYVWVAVLVGFSVLTAAGVVIARKKAII